jgi:hypothetical protein
VVVAVVLTTLALVAKHLVVTVEAVTVDVVMLVPLGPLLLELLTQAEAEAELVMMMSVLLLQGNPVVQVLF